MTHDDPDAAEAIAARRYWNLQFVRLAGIFLTFTGAMILVGQIDGGTNSDIIGPAMFVCGALVFFAVPILLAKRWKSGNP